VVFHAEVAVSHGSLAERILVNSITKSLVMLNSIHK